MADEVTLLSILAASIGAIVYTNKILVNILSEKLDVLASKLDDLKEAIHRMEIDIARSCDGRTAKNKGDG